MTPERIQVSATDKELLTGVHRYVCDQRADYDSVSVKLCDCAVISQGNVGPLVERWNERRSDNTFLNHPSQLVELEDQNIFVISISGLTEVNDIVRVRGRINPTIDGDLIRQLETGRISDVDVLVDPVKTKSVSHFASRVRWSSNPRSVIAADDVDRIIFTLPPTDHVWRRRYAGRSQLDDIGITSARIHWLGWINRLNPTLGISSDVSVRQRIDCDALTRCRRKNAS